jgi:hypothetical protein
MIYRKAPPQPVRLLLRVVSVAGAGAVALACSSGSGTEPVGGGIHGAVDSGGIDGGEDSSTGEGGFMGFVDGGPSPEGSTVCESGCGLLVNPDASADAAADALMGFVDGGTD